MKKLILILGVFLLTTLLSYQKYDRYIHNPVNPDNDTQISFQIKPGQPVKEIAANLQEKELINSATAFYLYSKFTGSAPDILAGRFLLTQQMNIPTIIETISNPNSAELIITVQEGLLIRDIAAKIQELNLTDSETFYQGVKKFNGWQYYDFLDSTTLQSLDLPLEGYLYPDTYFLDDSAQYPDFFLYLALDNFERKWNSLDKSNSTIAKKYSIHEIVTMASIIENEVFGEEDRQLVSGILWKRLESGWTIGADATLLYITEDRTITAQDLAIDSPYNTRKNLGLPPGPISNPSLSSLYAALYPKESQYWFYLTTLDTGEVIYATSNEQHNANRARYL